MEARKYAKRSLHDIFEVLSIGASAVLAIIRQKGQSQNGCSKKTKLIRLDLTTKMLEKKSEKVLFEKSIG